MNESQPEGPMLNWKKQYSRTVTAAGSICYNGSVSFIQANMALGLFNPPTGKHPHIKSERDGFYPFIVTWPLFEYISETTVYQ